MPRAAARQDRRPRARHVRRVDRVAGGLQREIRLDRAAEIERAAVEQRPAAVLTLAGAQKGGDALLELGFDAAEIVLQQDVFGRDRRVGFEFEEPMPVTLLPRQQRFGGQADRFVEQPGAALCVRRRSAPRARPLRWRGRSSKSSCRCRRAFGLVAAGSGLSSRFIGKRSASPATEHQPRGGKPRGDSALDRRRQPGVGVISGQHQIAPLCCRRGPPQQLLGAGEKRRPAFLDDARRRERCDRDRVSRGHVTPQDFR